MQMSCISLQMAANGVHEKRLRLVSVGQPIRKAALPYEIYLFCV